MKTCIVAGNAASLHSDLKGLDYPIIAVNGASREVKAFALFTQHPDKFPKWVRYQQRFHQDFKVYSCVESPHSILKDIPKGGGSAWGARKLATILGFDKVILCGCPMTPGPYVGNHNLGGFMHRKDIVDELFGQIKRDVDWHKGCISMSGRTKELLG